MAACFLTTSATDRRTTSRASLLSGPDFAKAFNSGGRMRLPTCVVNIRFSLLFIVVISHIALVGRDPCPAADAPVGLLGFVDSTRAGRGRPARLRGAAPQEIYVER